MIQNKYKILLVDGDSRSRNQVCRLLESAHYQVIHADSCAAAMSRYDSYLPELVLLEAQLPDGDGLKLLGYIRKDSLTPVLFLSRLTEEGYKVKALDEGANDYIAKPFGEAELLARIRVALRDHRASSAWGNIPQKNFTLKALKIHYDSRQVFMGNQEVLLTQTEYNILALLSEHCGKMMTYKAIIKGIWGSYAQEGSIKRLQVNMANIRKKLQLAPQDSQYLVNEAGVGYRMCGEN